MRMCVKSLVKGQGGVISLSLTESRFTEEREKGRERDTTY